MVLDILFMKRVLHVFLIFQPYCWGKVFKFSCEETTEKSLAPTVQKSWLLTKLGVCSKFSHISK